MPYLFLSAWSQQPAVTSWLPSRSCNGNCAWTALSTQQITATIYASDGPRALEARTAHFGDGRESTPPYSRRPHHIQPVHTLLPPIADDEETARISEELSTDLMSQFGL